MPRAALSDDEVQAFRAGLCEVAARLFATQGYAGVTLRALAAELGCSPMTPYRYFRDKDEIFRAVRTAAFDRFAEAQEAAAATAEEPVLRLEALGHAYAAFVRRDPHAYRIMFEMNRPEDGACPELRDAQARAWHPLRTAVEGAIGAGFLTGPPERVALIFWAGLHGIASLALAGTLPPAHPFESLVAPMQTALLEGHRDRTRSQEDTP